MGGEPRATWKWRSKDGRELTPREMDVRHIENCINVILRREGWRRRWLPVLYQEYHLRKQWEEGECDLCNSTGNLEDRWCECPIGTRKMAEADVVEKYGDDHKFLEQWLRRFNRAEHNMTIKYEPYGNGILRFNCMCGYDRSFDMRAFNIRQAVEIVKIHHDKERPCSTCGGNGYTMKEFVSLNGKRGFLKQPCSCEAGEKYLKGKNQ